jgi:hypothetical protein
MGQIVSPKGQTMSATDSLIRSMSEKPKEPAFLILLVDVSLLVAVLTLVYLVLYFVLGA